MDQTLHNSDAYAQFIEFFARGVPPSRFCMGIPKPALSPGLEMRNLAGWAQTFTTSKQAGYGLSWHNDPCTFLGLANKGATYFNLVMGRGEDYALDLVAFDELPDETRKGVAVAAICGISDCGCVPWFSSLREFISHEDAKRMVFWRQHGRA